MTVMITWNRLANCLILSVVSFTAAFAEEQDNALVRECFSRQVEIKTLEDKIRWLGLARADTGKEAARDLAAQITEKKVELHSILRDAERESSSEDVKMLQAIYSPKKEVRAALKPKMFSSLEEARKLSALEWETLADWFGAKESEKYFHQAFTSKKYSESALEKILRDRNVFVVQNPYAKITREANLKLPGSKPLELSGFVKIEDQVEELYRIVTEILPENSVLVSTKEASAIVLRMLDMHPEVRGSDRIAAWVNLNGRLYGSRPDLLPGKKLPEVVRSHESEYIFSLHGMSLERGMRMPSLGAGFPIYNIVSTKKEFRPVRNLREAVVADGDTFLTEHEDPVAVFAKALKRTDTPMRQPASQSSPR